MDYKRIKTDHEAVTRRLRDFYTPTGNIYESVVILSKRANQIAADLKEELNQKIQEFASTQDNLEEIYENREQIELARFYEKLPKPTLLAVHEFLNKQVFYRNYLKEGKDIPSF